MTAWTIGQTHRFKAAVCGAPCFDLESMYGTSDISHTFGRAAVGRRTARSARMVRRALALARSRTTPRTPTLIIQGEADDRCPIGQGEQMFVALKQAGCEVEFARYPGGSHLFMRTGPPSTAKMCSPRVLAWFEAHL